MPKLFLLLCWCGALPAFAQSAAHDDGIAAGTAANAAIRAQVNEASAAGVVPGFTRTPPEAALTGQGNLAARASARVADCAALPNDAVCQAQRGALAAANTPRPVISATDPAVATANAIARTPATILGNLSTEYNGCATGSIASASASAGQCAPDVFCLGASCFPTAYTRDTDFARMMTFMEAAREAGVYFDTDRLAVFEGEVNTCRERILKNCCASNSAGAGMTNHALFGVGSRLVYDVLTHAENRAFIDQGVQALLSGSGFAGSFTSYGVTIAVNGAPLPAGTVSLFASDSVVLAFDPWSLAITVTFAVVTSMASCNDEEAQLALKQGAHLCHALGDWCSSCIRVLGKCVSCIERTTSMCCFNSLLARLVNEQGRAQVGKRWGTAQQPDCSGFTVAQLQALDFAAMDLRDFYASIQPTLPEASTQITSNAAQVATLVAHPDARPPAPSVPAAQHSAPGPVPSARLPTPPLREGVAGPVGQDPAHYAATFAEEFQNGLNPARWNDAIWYQGSNAVKAYAVEDGVLKIWPQQNAQGQFVNQTIDTDGKFTQTYGYFEIEARLPIGKGTWPAFWLFNHIGARRPEIDVMEAYAGGGPASGWGNAQLHPIAYGATIWQDANRQAGFKMVTTPDLSAGFHTYGVKWEPDRQTFYFDGQAVYTVNVRMADPMYLMLDLWFGSASGAPDASTPTGKNNAYEINYVRAWEFK